MSKALVLPSALIAASGAMGTTGLGWIPLHRIYYRITKIVPVLKTVTRLSRKGNPLIRAWRPLWGKQSCVNAMALGNKGLWHLIQEILPRLKHDVIVSLHASSPEEMDSMVRTINDFFRSHPEWFSHLLAFEVNLSCPNVKEPADYLGILRVASRLPLAVIAKIAADKEQIAVAVTAAKLRYIQAISCINTIPWKQLMGEKRSPLRALTGQDGGISGRLIKQTGLDVVMLLRQLLPREFPILAGGGILTYDDVQEYTRAGATYIVLGTVLTQHFVKALVLLLAIRRFGIPATN